MNAPFVALLAVCLGASNAFAGKVGNKPHLLRKSYISMKCPEEMQRCALQASKGKCQGISSGHYLDHLWQQCPCSCMVAANHRAQLCCKAVGVSKQCLPMCRRNLTVMDLLSKKETGQCLDFLPHLNYCAGEGADVSKCCEEEGMSSECQNICVSNKGVLGCKGVDELISRFLPCAGDLLSMRMCYMKHVSFTPNVDGRWRPKC